MGIPIISNVISLVETFIDKKWPDASTKEQAKAEATNHIIAQAMQSEQLLFQDTEGARELFKAELEAKKAPSWARAFQVMARPFCMYSCITMYVWTKIAPMFNAPMVELNQWDYALMGSIFIFLFGARSFEKIKGRS